MTKCVYCNTEIMDEHIRCMNCDNIIKWCDKLVEYWEDKNIQQIKSLFDEECECYDTPFSSKGNVEEDWKEIEDQDIRSIHVKILAIKDNECFVEFVIDYHDEICNAINHIKFNDNNKCIYLKQWYMSKPNEQS